MMKDKKGLKTKLQITDYRGIAGSVCDMQEV